MGYELIVIWETGEKNIYKCQTEEEAEKAEKGFNMAFGKQIYWTGIRRER